MDQIEDLCRERGIFLLDIIKRKESMPSFEKPARLETIPNSQAVMELLRRFQGGHKSALLKEVYGGSTTRMFLELATIVDQADCYQLFVGSFHEMADQICELVSMG